MNALPQLEPSTQALPEGRYRATVEQIRDSFATSKYRQVLLDEWVAATVALREAVPVCSAWVGGSFFTAKEEPSDIDSLYFIDEQHLIDPTEEQRTILGAFASPGMIQKFMELRVDTYIVPWAANATTIRAIPEHRKYYENRGYWDDLWSKKRTGLNGGAPVRLDSHPRRGYVEVILDGYDQTGPFYAG